MKTNPNEIILLYNEAIETYKDNFGNLRSVAISDSGVMIISVDNFDPNVALSVVRILDAERLESPIYNEIWIRNFGAGVSITPSAHMVAIGSSDENLVYTYALNKKGVILKNTRSFIVSDNMASKSFGWRVGLSHDGTSVAVASPGEVVDSIQVGAIYVYVWVDGKWEGLDSVLYGSGGLRKIGIGGVAIDDIRGQLSIQDNNAQGHSFQVRAARMRSLNYKILLHVFLSVHHT